MKYIEYATQMKSLQILLYDCSIPHRLRKEIKPSKHPNMKMLMFCLKANNIDYEYFGPTESLVLHDVEPDSEFIYLCDTLIQPTSNGLKIYVHIQNEEYMYDTFNLIEECLDNLLPKRMSYKFIGAK